MLASKLQEAAGNSTQPTYIEDVFSTYLYTGNGSTQTINNGIDLAGKGGLVWVKNRTIAASHRLYDTGRGANQYLNSASTDGTNLTDTGQSFTSTGFQFASGGSTVNGSGNDYASWTFRKAPKFFDVQTITHTNGTADNIDLSGLGSVGCVIAKIITTTGDWTVWHRSLTTGNNIQLNTTAAQSTTNAWLSVSGTTATLAAAAPTGTYVIYAYAHNAGGFGLTGTDNVISCGSYTGNGSATGPVVTLGYEPQWLLVKNASATGYWQLVDNMRGMTVGGIDSVLWPNAADAEYSAVDLVSPLATGFQVATTSSAWNTSGNTYIYIAIRRGPMKVPTDGTKVFSSLARTGTGAATTVSGLGFSVDLNIIERRSGGQGAFWADRLRGANLALASYATDADITATQFTTGFDVNDGYKLGSDVGVNGSVSLYINWNFRRAPGFFDEVCYTGTGSAMTVNHNLGVAPELMIVKSRSAATDWYVKPPTGNNNSYLRLNATAADAPGSGAALWNSTAPTSTVFTVGTAGGVNTSGATYVAYLFASCPGVSKVGSYTGTGATQTINCGFTGGARFVLIKRTDSTGDWYVWDSARGIASGNDPYLLLNSTAAEVTTTDYIDPVSSGFEISSTAPAAINASGGSYIFLAIA